MVNRVRALRQAQGLTQREVAARVGITRQTLSLIEKGAYNPSLRLCLGLCDELHSTLDTVFWVPKEERA
ncbi:helix-turn-helix transcriptional regulator [Lactiplantibacillus modestisalitolerans]|uniref:Helix-turn-helix transcriptional regulator n=1 Tax=Lactiplantibacillus modestisalitolerans TaxID=1457219 RepID=A0ABV5WUB9_9LACO|nr:helix-turn-helix transcriptional regulator [Lactiplantibacillus modestisalitolerans]